MPAPRTGERPEQGCTAREPGGIGHEAGALRSMSLVGRASLLQQHADRRELCRRSNVLQFGGTAEVGNRRVHYSSGTDCPAFEMWSYQEPTAADANWRRRLSLTTHLVEFGSTPILSENAQSVSSETASGLPPVVVAHFSRQVDRDRQRAATGFLGVVSRRRRGPDRLCHRELESLSA